MIRIALFVGRINEEGIGVAQIRHCVSCPCNRNRKPREGAATDQEDAQDDALAGIAIWAKVSPEVDAKIREQIGSKVFPIRLKPADWASGEIT
jgi:cytolysin-activating lysine-acyltransferase